MQPSKPPLALVVGGSSGIGKQSAIHLLNAGVEVILLAHDPQKLADAETELKTTSEPNQLLGPVLPRWPELRPLRL